MTLEDLLEHEQAIYSTTTPATAHLLLSGGASDGGGGARGSSKGDKSHEGKGSSSKGSGGGTAGGGGSSGGGTAGSGGGTAGGGGKGGKGGILASRGVLLEGKIDALLTEIFKMQTFLLQLRQAFQDHPLALGEKQANKLFGRTLFICLTVSLFLSIPKTICLSPLTPSLTPPLPPSLPPPLPPSLPPSPTHSPTPSLAGWEVRVHPMTALPYWVDHINRVTSAVPPVHIPTQRGTTTGGSSGGGGRGGATTGGSSGGGSGGAGGGSSSTGSGSGPPSSYTLETLPEYRIYLAKLTKLLDQLDRVNSGTTTLTNHPYQSQSPYTHPFS